MEAEKKRQQQRAARREAEMAAEQVAKVGEATVVDGSSGSLMVLGCRNARKRARLSWQRNKLTKKLR